MKIECTNFLFHPFYPSHKTITKVLSVITNIALTILSCGAYLLILALVHLRKQYAISTPPILALPSPLQALKEKQKDHLAKLVSLAAQGQWEHLQTHTAHPDSGFDWWMFPINRPSAGYGKQYQVSKQDVLLLKQDAQFLQNYRKGVTLVAKSWGWDLEKCHDITTSQQRWTNYQVRLGKMLDSLKLFEQTDLHTSLIRFIELKGIRPTLADWVQKLC